MPQRFLRLNEVRARVPLSRSAIYDMIRRGEFAAPVKIGPRASAWLESDVEAWIAARLEDTQSARSAVSK